MCRVIRSIGITSNSDIIGTTGPTGIIRIAGSIGVMGGNGIANDLAIVL